MVWDAYATGRLAGHSLHKVQELSVGFYLFKLFNIHLPKSGTTSEYGEEKTCSTIPPQPERKWVGRAKEPGMGRLLTTQQRDHTSDSHDNNRTATSQGLEQIPTPKCKLANDLLVEIISCFICCHYVNECRLTCKDVPSTESLKQPFHGPIYQDNLSLSASTSNDHISLHTIGTVMQHETALENHRRPCQSYTVITKVTLQAK